MKIKASELKRLNDKITSLNCAVENQKCELTSLRAQLTSAYYNASKELSNISEDKLKGSGVILTFTNLSGNTLISPLLIKDGLKKETIAVLQNEINKSYKLSIMFKPVTLKEIRV